MKYIFNIYDAFDRMMRTAITDDLFPLDQC